MADRRDTVRNSVMKLLLPSVFFIFFVLRCSFLSIFSAWRRIITLSLIVWFVSGSSVLMANSRHAYRFRLYSRVQARNTRRHRRKIIGTGERLWLKLFLQHLLLWFGVLHLRLLGYGRLRFIRWLWQGDFFTRGWNNWWFHLNSCKFEILYGKMKNFS